MSKWIFTGDFEVPSFAGGQGIPLPAWPFLVIKSKMSFNLQVNSHGILLSDLFNYFFIAECLPTEC